MAKRFFVSEQNISINENIINVTGPEVHHINVLRHKIGDIVRINNYEVEIKTINQNEIAGTIKSVEDTNTRDDIFVTLYQSYIKADKM